MKNATKRSYTEIFADTVGNLFGFFTIAAGGAAIAAPTIALSATTGVGVAAVARAYNQFHETENQIEAYAMATEAATYVAHKGCQAFEYTQPMLFSIGHAAGATSVQIAAFTLDKAYSGAQSLYKCAEPKVTFQNEDNDSCAVSFKP